MVKSGFSIILFSSAVYQGAFGGNDLILPTLLFFKTSFESISVLFYTSTRCAWGKILAEQMCCEMLKCDSKIERLIQNNNSRSTVEVHPGNI